MNRMYAALAALFLLLPFSSTGGILYVNGAATGSNIGTSWANAFTNLQTALGGALAGDQIWVARGVYKPGGPGSSRTVTFGVSDDNLKIYGGFAGGETALSQRNWTNNVTVLSGDLAGNDTTDAHGVVLDWSDIVGTDNCYNVIDVRGLTFTLDGFTVTAGLADKTDVRCPPAVGAGMFVLYGNTTLHNVVFRGNYGNLQPGGAIYFWADGSGVGSVSNASFIGNASCQGGAVYVRTGSYRFDNVLFQNNDARDPLGQSGTALVGAGGLIADGANNVVINSRFVGNTAQTDAGGLYASAPMTLSNVLFQANYASVNAGGMWDESGSQLTDVRFLTNSAATRGGGIISRQISGGPGVYTRLLFQGNSASRGGAFYSEGGSPDIYDSVFVGNSASEGATLWTYYANPKLMNCVIRGNSGYYGSVLCGMFGVATFNGVTMYGNSGNYMLYDYTASDPLTIQNSIIWGNSGTLYSGDVVVTTRYSIVQGGSFGGTSDHIYNVDPQFVDAANGNMHLLPTSPAIDAGDNAVTNALRATDVEGSTRRVDIAFVTDTGNGTSPIVDMGAYEAQSSYVITATNGPSGSGLTYGSGSYSFGATVTVSAAASAGYRFWNWCDGGSEQCCVTAYTFRASCCRSLTAIFDPLETSNRVPTAWYRGYGLGPATGASWTTAQWTAFDYTNSSGNGTPNWNAYYADLNPTNSSSRFVVTAITNDGPSRVYFTPSSTGRVYTLKYCNDLSVGAWTQVAGQVNVRGGTNWLSDASAAPVRFYRLSVNLP